MFVIAAKQNNFFMSERNKMQVEEFRMIACDQSLTDEQIRTYLQWGKGKLDVALNYYYNKIQKNKPIVPPPPPPNNAYKKLKEGAEKEKRTLEYIDNLKKEYNLPIKAKPSPEQPALRNSSEFSEIDYIPDILNSARGFEEYKQFEPASNLSQKFVPSPKPPTKRHSTIKLPSQLQPPVFCKPPPPPPPPQKPPSSQPLPIQPQQQYTKQMSQTSSTTRQTRDLPSNCDVHIGGFLVNCFAVTNLFLPGCDSGEAVEIRIQKSNKTEEAKTKRTKRANERIMMRIAWADREIGRVEDEDAQFMCALMEKGFIRMETTLKDSLNTVSHFTPFKVKAEVYLKKSTITIPIVETYQNKNDQNQIIKKFGQVRENFITLFRKLELVITKYPLIKLRSKYDQATKVKRQIKPSAPLNPEAFSQAQMRTQKQDFEKANNPFFKQVQKSLSDMFVSRPSSESSKVIEKPQKMEYEGAMTKQIELKPSSFEQLVDLHQQNLQQAEPTPIFVAKLHQYQSLALSWMLRRQGKSAIQEEQSLHPMWTQYELASKSHLYFNEFTGQISAQPPYFKSKCKGGILADEMGLGKTVMLIALMCSNQCQNKKSAKNLIVLPLTLLEQWQSEIILHTKQRSLRVLKYYEQKDRKLNLLEYDVVLTTYGVVSQEFSEGNHISCTGLFKHEWFRIILDQAHYIKGRVIQTARAVFSLRSQINWCLTGTPIQNKLQDLFSLIHFIRYTPWSDYNWWNTYINKPHQDNDPVVYDILRTILKKVLLRRTKQSKKADGQPIIKLPPKHSRIQFLKLSSKQQEFYNAVFEASKKEFDELDGQGIIEAKYMKIFEILMRLRQICCHPALFKSVTKFSTTEDFPAQLKKWLKRRIDERNDVDNHARFQLVMEGEEQVRIQVGKLKYNQKHLIQVLESIDRNELELCSVCMDPLENPVVTVCLHTFCKSCIIQSMQTVGFCPKCRNIINKDDFIPLPRENRLGISYEKNFRPSTKMQALMAHLKTMDKDSKAVVFSQFLGMIDLIQEHMRREKIEYVRMDGSLSQKQRCVVIDKFKTDPRCQVFIISLKSGGVGLNLVAANKVFMVDPWWNPAVEEQAIQRVHRIGQKREVEVYRFIVQNSIENRMMDLHQDKRKISAMAMSEKESKQNNMEKFRYLMTKY